MSQELLYTSVAPGVIPGLKGYCTVARTGAMPERLILLLEQSLSDYRYSAEGNPPAVWSHLRVREGLRELSVLSRKTPVADHSGRPSVFAHHVILGPDEQPAGGPAWVLGERTDGLEPADFLVSAWDGRVGTISDGRKPERGDREPARCAAWESGGLDPGWAGVLAETFLATPDRPSCIIYRPGRDLLPLIEDAIALLPVERRWSVTFTTYYTGLPPNIPCAWRWVVAGSPEAQQAQRSSRGLVLNLDAPPAEPRGGALVELARTGKQATRTIVAKPAATRTSAPDRWGPGARRARAATTATAVPEAVIDDSNRLRRRRKGPSVAAIAVSAAAVVFSLGCLVYWLANQTDLNMRTDALLPDGETVADNSPTFAEDREAVRSDPPAVKTVEPAPKPAVAPTNPIVKSEPEPDPAVAPVHRRRSANVKLPAASTSVSEHDSAARVLNVPLPKAQRFVLELRGLDDPEVKLQKLAVRPAVPGHPNGLAVIRDAYRGIADRKPATLDSAQKLAEFWVDDGRLYFQWTPKIGESLLNPSRALRDCILVVTGGGERVDVVLRDMLHEKHELTGHEEPKAISWKKSSVKPLTMTSCQVKDRNDVWRDVPAAADPNFRELTIPDPVSGEARYAAKLHVKLTENGGAIGVRLEPPVTKIDQAIKGQEKNASEQQTRLKVLTGRIRELDGHLAGLMNSLRQASARLGYAKADASARRAELREAGHGSEQIDNHPLVKLADGHVQNALNEVSSFKSSIDEITKNKQIAVTDRTETQEKAEMYRNEIAATRKLRERVNEWSKKSIRVQLGVVIDGEKFAVMQIGPW